MSMVKHLAGCCAWAALASLAYAQPKPAVVQDRDEPGRAPYQHRVHAISCSVPTSCSMFFPAVPANHRLVITYVNMSYFIDPLASSHVFLGGSGTHLRLAGPAPDFASSWRTISLPVTLYVESGDPPSLNFEASTAFAEGAVSATVVGYLVALP